jgi:hypothetical protein
MWRIMMISLLGGLAIAAIVAVAPPAWSQGVTTQGAPTQQNAPGTGGTSKAGLPGMPGTESGPAVSPSGTTMPEPSLMRRNDQQSGDESGVPGKPDTQSGPSVRPSDSGR